MVDGWYTTLYADFNDFRTQSGIGQTFAIATASMLAMPIVRLAMAPIQPPASIGSSIQRWRVPINSPHVFLYGAAYRDQLFGPERSAYMIPLATA
jgi:hypothetical protein